MGGVDKHDQLRLQSHSLQLSTRFKKYYHSLFLGLVDIAIINAYITHIAISEKRKKRKMSHYDFLAGLHEAHIASSESDFTTTTSRQSARMVATSAESDGTLVVPSEHTLVQVTDTRANNGVTRLRQRQCRVCTLLAREEGRKRPGTTTWYCQKCSTNRRGLLFMCNKIRGHPSSPGLTFSQIYHSVCRNGEFAPTSAKVRDRVLQKPHSMQS
ncbi:hypothetical protein PF010_g24262 [Phytophthora fragariae]|uniref:PiggyBac transposable element-derived protein domain-containing protein n=1 Tax=Phytophthora fragariae TaxID=53985 RepID=A0A6G0K3K8_9STRA|nr:hypothetical protein PF010_g24262 [Phytophthora fragariae]